MTKALPFIGAFCVLIGPLDVSNYGSDFRSATGRYSVELTRNAEGKVLVAVFQHTNNVKTLSWSKPINWEDPFAGWWSGVNAAIVQIRALVTEDGKAVVLRDSGANAPDDRNGVRIVGLGVNEDHRHRLDTFDRAELTGRATGGYPALRRGVAYYSAAALLDFIIDEENVYAIYFGQTDQWLLISLKDFRETIVRDEEQLRHLNKLAREKAEKLVLEHQPTPLRRAVSTVEEQLGKIFPSLAPHQLRRWMDTDIAPAYLFLAARKKGSDKAYIENLVTFPAQGVQHQNLAGAWPMRFTFTRVAAERLIGDFLLARWNGETNRQAIPMDTYLMIPDEPLTYLGIIRGSIKLPIKIPNNGGNMWAYLIPSRVRVGKWNESSDVILFVLSLNQGRGPNNMLPNEGEIVFKAILPGEYRVKFVWERHPASGFWRTNMYTAAPGDYESTESSPITVKAGETVRDISILCTNRIGDATAYEEDDGVKKDQP
jgi:hypothetical protein